MSRTDPGGYRPEELRPADGRLPERSTAGAFLIREGKVLLEKRPADARVYPGLLDTPGGHVDEGETPEAALSRELEEELGIVPERFILGMVQDDLDPRTGIFYRHFVYIVRSWKGVVTSREGRRLEWFPFREALDLEALNPLIGYALREFIARGWI